MSVFPRLLLFYRIFGCFSAMGVQKHYKKRFAKKIVSKSFNKKFDQKSKTDFFSIFVYHVFGCFSVRGVQKHDKKISKKTNLTLVIFWPLTHLPTTGVTDFFLIGGPLEPAELRAAAVALASSQQRGAFAQRPARACKLLDKTSYKLQVTSY
jgi:hypothetical protein